MIFLHGQEKEQSLISLLTSGLSVSDYSFVSFFDRRFHYRGICRKLNIQVLLLVPDKIKQTGMEMNFDLQVTPDAEVQIIFDAKVGDVMKGRGTGDLNISSDKKWGFQNDR